MSVVGFAYEVINMQERILAQQEELERLRKIEQEHIDLLYSSIKHGDIMSHQVMTLLLNEGKFPNSEKINDTTTKN